MHDPRIGRFFAIDPLAKKYAWNSPYSFSENKVIANIELEGLEQKYYTLKLNDDKPVLQLVDETDVWYLPDLFKVEIPELELTYTFMSNSLEFFNGDKRNNLNKFEDFKKDPLAAIFSAKFKSDQEEMEEMKADGADLLMTVIMMKYGNTGTVPTSKAPKWLTKIREGVKFQKTKIQGLIKDKVNFKSGIRLVPKMERAM